MTSTMPEKGGASTPTTPPRDDLYRALPASIGLVRAESDDEDAMPTLIGRFAVFNEFTEINSMWEGNFMERIAPGAFRKTIKDNRAGMRVLFNHGQDPQIGDKVLGSIRDLREEADGAYYEVPLFDTSYNRDLIPGLEAGVYGASFRFKVMREEIVDNPKPSATNPHALPERTIKEALVREFGPVTFPAYAGSTAGLRSMTDEFMFQRFLSQPDKLRELLTAFLPSREEEGGDGDDAPTRRAEPSAHPVVVRRDTRPLFGLHKEEKPTWRL